MIQNLFIICFAISSVTLLGGCAHPISVVPPDVIRSLEMPDRIKSRVGVFISPESLSLEVITPGGGGDSVKYFPYRDIESGYQRMLANVFDDVVRVPKLVDIAEFEKAGISYIISPQILTNSGSSSILGWPPTNFSVDLTSQIKDVSGKLLFSPRVIGVANASVEFGIGGNRGIAGQLAMKDALQKMQLILIEALGQKGSGFTINSRNNLVNSSENVSLENRLSSLKFLLDKNLITNEDYEKKKLEILKIF